jgi:hypothetical protein
MATTTADTPTREELHAALELVLQHSIDVTAAAAQTGRAYTTLRRRLARGDFPSFKLGRDTRIWRQDLGELATP